MKRRRPAYAGKVRTLDVPVPEALPKPEQLLSSKLGSKAAADRSMAGVAHELGISQEAPRSTLAAIALAKLGADLDGVAKSLGGTSSRTSAPMLLAAAGYDVKRNVRLRKPTRQIDIVAESPSLVLAVDCKHWRRGAGGGRSRWPRHRPSRRGRGCSRSDRRPGESTAYLPVLLTMLDNQVEGRRRRPGRPPPGSEGVPLLREQVRRGALVHHGLTAWRRCVGVSVKCLQVICCIRNSVTS